MAERTCRHCSSTFTLLSPSDHREWCSKSCARRDDAAAKSAARLERLIGTIPSGADVVEIPLTKGQVALIDVADVAAVARWSWQAVFRGKSWYARNRESRYMHHVVLGQVPGREIDHVNGNGLDNRRCNLRHATRTQNRANQHHASGASGTKGVYWHKRDQVWQAALAGKHLGYFTNKADAINAYNAAAKAAYGEFACQT